MGVISLIERSEKSGLECIGDDGEMEKGKRGPGERTKRALNDSGAAGESEGNCPE